MLNREAEGEVARLTRAMFDLDPNLVGEELAEETDRLFRAAMEWAYRDCLKQCAPYTRRPHTFASENADRYRGFRDGALRCIDAIESRLESSKP